MTLTDDIGSAIDSIFNATWSTRDGLVVPSTDDIALANGAVRLNAVFLYADLAGSTTLARKFPHTVAAKVVRAYLSAMTRVVKANGGEVRSFDGDRVMGVFLGDAKNSNAAKCALKMKYVVSQVLRPKAETKYPSLKTKGFAIRHCAGIHASNVLVVRAGVRGSNDLVFVGSAPNLAAKLSNKRDGNYQSYMTWSVHENLNKDAKFGKDGRAMWTAVKCALGDETWDCYKSSWWWKP